MAKTYRKMRKSRRKRKTRKRRGGFLDIQALLQARKDKAMLKQKMTNAPLSVQMKHRPRKNATPMEQKKFRNKTIEYWATCGEDCGSSKSKERLTPERIRNVQRLIENERAEKAHKDMIDMAKKKEQEKREIKKILGQQAGRRRRRKSRRRRRRSRRRSRRRR